MVVWVVVTVVSVVGMLWAVQFYRADRRTEAWKRVASELGLEYLGSSSDFVSRFGHLKLLERGRSHAFRNAVRGDSGDTEILIGDLSYVTGSGKSRTVHVYTACALVSSSQQFPHCFLRPELKLFDFIGGLFGGKDIDFADDPAFSRAYVLQGDYEPAVRQLFTSDVRAYFAARKPDRWKFEAKGHTIMFHGPGKLSPDAARELIAQALEIRSLLAGGTGPRRIEAEAGASL